MVNKIKLSIRRQSMPGKATSTKPSEQSSKRRSAKKPRAKNQSSKKASPAKPVPSRSIQADATAPAHAPLRAVNSENAEHYPWGDACDGWHLVKDEKLSVIEELMPPGTAESRHHHERAQQFFYILSGELLIQIEEETTLVHAGSGIRILPGVRHQVRNPASMPTRFLVISQPPSHGDRVDG
jgi:mannose-6-phosphate isomerase-like protein (cupin superfamily)